MKKLIITLICLLVTTSTAFAEKINVAFTIDNNYPIFTMLAINSILQNNTSNSDYKFFIVENNLTDKNKAKMRKYVKARHQEIEFFNIDTKVIDDGKWFFGFSNRITPIGMARIMLPQILPSDVHRVIYMDGDTLVIEDLKKLFDEDLKGKAFGMSPNIINYSDVVDFKTYSPYLNSGVILMDLDKCRKNHVTDKMLGFIKKNFKLFIYKGDKEGSFLYPDQDLINIVLIDDLKTLPQRWNNQNILGTYMTKLNDGGVLHYIGPVKPWHMNKAFSNDFVVEYYKYWDKSGLRAYKIYYGLGLIKDKYAKMLNFKLIRLQSKISYFTEKKYLKLEM